MILFFIAINSGGKDFIETPHQFVFTPQAQRHCFNVRLIDDTIFEATQHFFVNLTTAEENISLSPNFIVITVNDDDCKFELASEKVTAWVEFYSGKGWNSIIEHDNHRILLFLLCSTYLSLQWDYLVHFLLVVLVMASC